MVRLIKSDHHHHQVNPSSLLGGDNNRSFFRTVLLGVFLLGGGIIVCHGQEEWSYQDGGVPSLELQHLNTRVQKGKEYLNKLQEKAVVGKGTCWQAALEELNVKCKDMSPQMQSRLALKFTTCYNELFGFPIVICEFVQDVSTCVQQLDSNSMNTFRDFFLHTQDMCYYLEHQLWQERTNSAVNKVTSAVVDVTKNIEESRVAQEQVLSSQKESLKVQADIAKEHTQLHQIVKSVKEVFDDVQASTEEQRGLVMEVFTKLSNMHKLVQWIQGEMSLLDLMGFYFACMLFGFFSTATKRTQYARFWIVVLLMMSIMFERYVYGHLNGSGLYAPEIIQEYIWLMRRAAVVFGVVIILTAAALYRDPQMVQEGMLASLTNLNQRLENMTLEMSQVRRFIMLNEGDSSDDSDFTADDEESEEASDNGSIMVHNDSLAVAPPRRLRKPILLKSKAESINDENSLPVGNDGMRQRLRGQSIEPGQHSYNLRVRNNTPGPESPQGVIHEKSTSVSTNKARPSISAGYFSSDEEL